MDDKIIRQILAVRDTGKTNMFDVIAVQRLTLQMGLYELVAYLEEHRAEYVRFILMGQA